MIYFEKQELIFVIQMVLRRHSIGFILLMVYCGIFLSAHLYESKLF